MYVLAAVLACGFLYAGYDDDIWGRGDANNDGTVNLSDPIYITDWLYRGGPVPPCKNGADANDDGAINLADVTYLNNWLFNGGPPPPSPGSYNPYCMPDPTEPHLGCEVDSCN